MLRPGSGAEARSVPSPAGLTGSGSASAPLGSRAPNAVPRLRTMPTDELTLAESGSIRTILWEAFGDGEDAFAEDDWTHALGGIHFVLDLDGEIVAHASVVERVLWVGAQPIRTGYVEAVATDPDNQGRGFGTLVMAAATAHVRESFDLGALGTGRLTFYQRLGWEAWGGPAFVREPSGLVRTPEDEGYLLVLRTPSSPSFDGNEPLSCQPRVGEPW